MGGLKAAQALQPVSRPCRHDYGAAGQIFATAAERLLCVIVLRWRGAEERGGGGKMSRFRQDHGFHAGYFTVQHLDIRVQFGDAETVERRRNQERAGLFGLFILGIHRY